MHMHAHFYLLAQAALLKLTSSPLGMLKAIQYCSWLTVRGAYTSDFKFKLEVGAAASLPVCGPHARYLATMAEHRETGAACQAWHCRMAAASHPIRHSL